MENMWETEKLLIPSNFSFSHNVFHSYISLVCQNVALWAGMRLKPKRKKWENGSRIWGSAILKEVFSTYEELSSREVIPIHNIPSSFFTESFSLIILEFSHLIYLNHKTLLTLKKNRKSSKNRENLMPVCGNGLSSFLREHG